MGIVGAPTHTQVYKGRFLDHRLFLSSSSLIGSSMYGSDKFVGYFPNVSATRRDCVRTLNTREEHHLSVCVQAQRSTREIAFIQAPVFLVRLGMGAAFLGSFGSSPATYCAPLWTSVSNNSGPLP